MLRSIEVKLFSGMMMAEHVMQRVANFLNLPNEVVRRKNLMKAGDVYPLGQRSNQYIASMSHLKLRFSIIL